MSTYHSTCCDTQLGSARRGVGGWGGSGWEGGGGREGGRRVQ